MNRTYDVIVLGVGGMGSAALARLALAGHRVLGIERFDIAHDRGSSHGETRVIRKAYFEHPDYVPLLNHAYKLWEELEDATDSRLFERCGLYLAGLPDGEAISGVRQAQAIHDLDIVDVRPKERSQRFPQFRIPESFDAVFEADAGFLRVEACVRAHVEVAIRHGATLALHETVLAWNSDGTTVRVTTEADTYEAAALVIAGGAWSGRLLEELSLPLTVLRKPLYWFPTQARGFDLDQGATTFFVDVGDGHVYGFPSIDGRTVKLAAHSGGDPVDDPLHLDRTSHQADVDVLASFVSNHVVGVGTEPTRHAVCMYTMTPDGHFIVDRHPAHANVVLAAGFSGHGFKFASVVGQALADLATSAKTALPIDFLSLRRFRI